MQIGQGNFRDKESQGKVREFHKLGPKLFGMQHFKCLKMLIFFSRSLDTIKIDVIIENLCPKKTIYFLLNCRIREVHFNELENSIFHLSAARREECHKNSVFWSGKNRTLQSLYNATRYNTVLVITRPSLGSQMVIFL